MAQLGTSFDLTVNPKAFWDYLRQLTQRGLLDAGQANQVWRPFLEAAQSGSPHLIRAQTVWGPLLDQVLSGTLSFDRAEAAWQRFLSTGTITVGGVNAQLAAAAPIRDDGEVFFQDSGGGGGGGGQVGDRGGQGGEATDLDVTATGGGRLCGPTVLEKDASEWFLKETRLWMEFAWNIRRLLEDRIRDNLRRRDKRTDKKSVYFAMGGGSGTEGWRLNGSVMLWLGLQPDFHSTKFKSKTELCPTAECPKTVSICDKCWHQTEIGNFLLGVLTRSMGFSWRAALAGSVKANTGFGRDQSSSAEFGKFTLRDKAAVRLGFLFSKSDTRKWIDWDVEKFCDWASKQRGAGGSLERVITEKFTHCGTPCASIVESNSYHSKFPKLGPQDVAPKRKNDGSFDIQVVGFRGMHAFWFGSQMGFYRLYLQDKKVVTPPEVIGTP